MKFTVTNVKITSRHLLLLAIVYVRQSTVRQVEEHPTSAAYQRSFSDLARQYGWTDDLIVELDVDQGVSGSDVAGRKGFQWLRQQIFDGKVGAIFCWEASRLARDSSAFAHLIKLCAVTDTIIIDEKGVYDPNNLNDRIFLGIMGVLSEAEGRRIVEKAIATKWTLAEAGELHIHPPTGYILDGENRLVLDPAEEGKVQDTIHLFFSKFEELGSAMQVVKYFNGNGIKFPTRRSSGKLDWVEISHGRALSILRNACYAGAYAYGLSQTVSKMRGVETTEQEKRRIKRRYDADGVILIHGTHEGYITWEQFLRNQERIKENCLSSDEQCQGPPRNGPALLQGIVYCDQCERGMSTRYASSSSGRKKQIVYTCNYEQRMFGKKTCFSTVAQSIDRAVADALLEAISPAMVRITLQALEQVKEQAEAEDRRRRDAIARAKEEVEKARIRYDSINPRNRLVAEEYEDKLEMKKAEVKRLEAERERALSLRAGRLPDAVRRSLLALPQDFRSVWEWENLTNVRRKRLLRFLIKRVRLKKGTGGADRELIIDWASGASTPVAYRDARYLDPKVVELMRKLAPDHTVPQIIESLHKAGFKPVQSERFNRAAILFYFRAYGIKLACPGTPRGNQAGPRGDGRYGTSAVAKMLNVSAGTVLRMCECGILDTVYDKSKGPRWIKISQEQVERLKRVDKPKDMVMKKQA